jgi:hypothetical protein
MAATHLAAMTSGTLTGVNPGSINDQSRGSVDVTLTGIAAGDLLVLEPPTTLASGLAYAGHRITADTVTIFLYNSSGAAINDGALDWRYVWWDRT